MSGQVPTGSPLPPMQSGLLHGDGKVIKQSNSPYGLSATNYNFANQQRSSELNSAVAYATEKSLHSSSNYSPSALKGDSSCTDLINVHNENSELFTKCSPGIRLSGPICNTPVQNGLVSSPLSPQTNPNFTPDLNVGTNFMNGAHSDQLIPPLPQQQWPSPVKIPAHNAQSFVQQPLVSGLVSSNQFVGQINLQDRNLAGQDSFNKVAPEAMSVPSPSGLPLPYNSHNASLASPQITPRPSQPPSARSSRNPSPISSQRYDFMEGQFSNKPSPSNSSTNLMGMNHGSNLSTAQGPPPPPSHPINGNSLHYANVPGRENQSAMFASGSPYANVSQPVLTQPLSNSSMPPVSGFSPGNFRPRFPPPQGPYQYPPQQQQQHSPAMTSQPGFVSPTGYLPPPMPPLPEMPDGPVGGVSGYDPQLHAQMSGLSVNSGFSRLWGNENINLLQDRNILPALPLEAPKPVLPMERANCSSKIFRCTLTKIPDSNALLQKSRLPFGILIHPFRDISTLSVIQCNTIVRCRNCRTYINPFVTFVDQRRWQCNLCFRPNDLPEEFLYDPMTRSYGDPARRPEIKNATMEFIAPSDYMLRPPQPAVYLFILDVSHGGCEIGYLELFCKIMIEHLDDLPGDTRTKVGFITFDGSIHFYNLAEGLNQPHMLIVSDIEDVFLPSPDSLLVNLHESKALICDLLQDLPKRFANSGDTNSCLGAVLQIAFKLMAPVGGRVTVVQASLPNCGPGLLKLREDPNQRAGKDVSHVGPANDFYKKLALECSSQQVAVDLFVLSSQYVDIATISCISRYSSGCIQYYPGFHHQSSSKAQIEKFTCDLKRYLTRRIGFEAVMRIRCTRGLAIHTFHGNFFVRSTDLLSLPNVNPDIGFGMQIAIEESLTECNSVCFQAAVLYTSSNGERRIRVHTLSLPVVSMLNDVWAGADQEAIVGLVSKMAVDRSVTSSLGDARDALINVAMDLLGAFKKTNLQSSQSTGALVSPYSVRLVPLFILALLKHVAFRTGVSTKLDDRVFAMERMKTLPLCHLMKYIYPTLYPVHNLDDKNGIHQDDDVVIPQPVILQLSCEKLDRHGAYVLDTFDTIYLYIGQAISDFFCQNCLGVLNFSAIPEDLVSLPELHTPESERLRTFISWLQEQRPSPSPLKIIREDSGLKQIFIQYMMDDRTEALFSYYEFLQHLRQQISK